jgi:hypothetical protein
MTHSRQPALRETSPAFIAACKPSPVATGLATRRPSSTDMGAPTMVWVKKASASVIEG